MAEIVIIAAFSLLVIVMMEGLLPLSETLRYCRMTRSAFDNTDELLYYTSTAPDEYIYRETEYLGINDVELPFEMDGNIFTTSRYTLYTDHRLTADTGDTDANGNLKPIKINMISYYPSDWEALKRGTSDISSLDDKGDAIGLLITQDLVKKYGYTIGDRFSGSVEWGFGKARESEECRFYVAGIIGDDEPVLSIGLCSASFALMSHISVNRDRLKGEDASYAIAIDPNCLLPENDDRYESAIISVPEGFDPKSVAEQFNEEYASQARLVPYTQIEGVTISQSWEGNSFSLLLLITLGIVLLTSFTGFTVTKTDRMRQTIKNLYINGLSRTKILALFFTYYMTLIVPAFVIGLAVFPVLAAERFHGYNPLINTGSALLFAFFLLVGTLITLFSLRKNLIITYDKA